MIADYWFVDGDPYPKVVFTDILREEVGDFGPRVRLDRISASASLSNLYRVSSAYAYACPAGPPAFAFNLVSHAFSAQSVPERECNASYRS